MRSIICFWPPRPLVSLLNAIQRTLIIQIKILMNKSHSTSTFRAPVSTVALESQVKDVLWSAKAKLTDLNKDIDKLSKENENIQK